MVLIDFHAHILPGIDDGAATIDESKALLLSQRDQGVETVVATPHYLKHTSITKFIAERDAALAVVREQIQEEIPEIIPAAEVELYYGLSKRNKVDRLCIQGTNYILVELPMEYWNDWIYDELYSLSVVHGLRPIVAHLDRYVLNKKNSQHIEKLLKTEVLVQVNVGSLLTFSGRRIVKRLWNYGAITVLGSDCHDSKERTCELRKGCAIFQKLFGKNALETVLKNSKKILENEVLYRNVD